MISTGQQVQPSPGRVRVKERLACQGTSKDIVTSRQPESNRKYSHTRRFFWGIFTVLQGHRFRLRFPCPLVPFISSVVAWGPRTPSGPWSLRLLSCRGNRQGEQSPFSVSLSPFLHGPRLKERTHVKVAELSTVTALYCGHKAQLLWDWNRLARPLSINRISCPFFLNHLYPTLTSQEFSNVSLY